MVEVTEGEDHGGSAEDDDQDPGGGGEPLRNACGVFYAYPKKVNVLSPLYPLLRVGLDRCMCSIIYY